ncbi:MAG: hypothetical protein WBL35_08710 [Ornithinibacter sp.]
MPASRGEVHPQPKQAVAVEPGLASTPPADPRRRRVEDPAAVVLSPQLECGSLGAGGDLEHDIDTEGTVDRVEAPEQGHPVRVAGHARASRHSTRAPRWPSPRRA